MSNGLYNGTLEGLVNGLYGGTNNGSANGTSDNSPPPPIRVITDPQVLSFLAATGITEPYIQQAVNTYVLGLKNENIWNRIVNLFPFVGGNATAHRVNLKSSGNFLGSTFVGGVTHNSYGITTNGTTGYFNTTTIPNVHLTLNNESLFLYSRTQGQGNIDMGAAATVTQRDTLSIRTSGNIILAEVNTAANAVGASNSNANGFYMASRISSTDLSIYKNGQLQNTNTTANTGTRTLIATFLGGRNVAGALNSPSARNYALCGTGLGFTPTQAAIFYNLTQQFQIALGRAV